ncbi:hypothetical protein CPLU01_13785 [Colletotrichum plurivorum]|uniref:Major facilitator superfamily (MFS) profile domain-containing protein n=1 Tax=Colletotrichum plurivorum TaxID=2175906 RepID=A0A8H6JPE0_9PEZI|nr:hypothetical protein CPLU01_13785 [Colletotrichum plurivorum]
MAEEVTATEMKTEQSIAPPPPYTTFSLRYRWYLTILLGYCCLASSLTANIYFPLISVLADHYGVSVQDINLTITLYVVFQGIAPAVFSPLSDSLGRRPVYIASFSLYTAASVGLAFSGRSYAALLLLRAVQSIGGSATLSLAYVVVADYAVPAERGRFLGPMMAATNVGPSIGPIMGGGAILATGNIVWGFLALVIFGASALSLIVLSMRETNRGVVGNESVRPAGPWRTWWDIVFAQGKHFDAREVEIDDGTPSPIRSDDYTITTSIPLIYGVDYGFNDLLVGCCYLAGGAGIILGGVVAGRLMDSNYRYTARESGLPVDRVAGDDMRTFPIERARSRGSYSIIAVSAFAFVGYGWAVERHAHVAVPLVLQFYLGCKSTVVHQVYSALLVDIFPDKPGTAGASNNICRCALSAALVAALQPAVDAMGRSWFFTLVGLWDAVGSIIGVFVLRRHGRRWRDYRQAREIQGSR